mgnify:CR=1 FL=1
MTLLVYVLGACLYLLTVSCIVYSEICVKMKDRDYLKVYLPLVTAVFIAISTVYLAVFY